MGLGKVHVKDIDGGPVRTITVTETNAKREIEKRMGELVDLLAIFLDTPIDPRAWSQLLIYAPKPASMSDEAFARLAESLGAKRSV